MSLSRALTRSFHGGRVRWGAATATAEKSALAKLRKTTGYSFSKCKEALVKHQNDLIEAEKWLRSEAQAHGWEKATKVQGRSTGQGLISILSSPSNALILEVNCETDFVARNKKFQLLVQRLTQGCFALSKDHTSGSLLRNPLNENELAGIRFEDRSLKDEVALSIGELGENIKARRAVIYKSCSPILLAGYTHPASAEGEKEVVQFGKFGAVVAYKVVSESRPEQTLQVGEIGRQLCQHIVGMNPTEIGSMEPPPPGTSKPDESKRVKVEEESGSTEEDLQVSSSHEIDETVLLNQEFLLDPDLTVRDFLLQNSIEVLDFVRFECGESLRE